MQFTAYYFTSEYLNIWFGNYNELKMILHYYHFHSWLHHSHLHNCKCNHLLGQYSFHRFDKGLWHIHQYLEII